MPDLQEKLQRSEAQRKALLSRFGFIPRSIIQMGRGALSRKMFIYQAEEAGRSSKSTRLDAVDDIVGDEAKANHLELREAGIVTIRARRMADVKRQKRNQDLLRQASEGGEHIFVPGYDGGSDHQGRLNASIMPAELVDFFVRYYAEPGQVYLDPFMGQGIQMQVSKMLGLHYRGYDLSQEFFAYIDAVRAKIDDGATLLDIHLGDSRFPVEIPDGIGDFAFHSPPYWDIEYYGDEPEQVGSTDTYAAFLDGMRQVYAAWLPKFKPEAYHVINVNDFRRNGHFYPYHADTIRIAQEAGWVYHDMWIIDGLVGGLPRAFAVHFNLKRIAPKTHEYALVFRSPAAR
jgi:hypothetical protein